MSYLYCVEIAIDTQDDVNALFRKLELQSELVMAEDGKIFICPQLSHKMWSIYPQHRELSRDNSEVDERWDEAMAQGVALLEERYKARCLNAKAWRDVAVYRCAKMEHAMREYDIS